MRRKKTMDPVFHDRLEELLGYYQRVSAVGTVREAEPLVDEGKELLLGYVNTLKEGRTYRRLQKESRLRSVVWCAVWCVFSFVQLDLEIYQSWFSGERDVWSFIFLSLLLLVWVVLLVQAIHARRRARQQLSEMSPTGEVLAVARISRRDFSVLYEVLEYGGKILFVLRIISSQDRDDLLVEEREILRGSPLLMRSLLSRVDSGFVFSGN